MATCINFSASANVSGVTVGPAPAPVPNVGGAPAVLGVDCELPDGVCLRQAVAATSTAIGAVIRNWRRVFMVEESSPGLLDRQSPAPKVPTGTGLFESCYGSVIGVGVWVCRCGLCTKTPSPGRLLVQP